MLDAVLECAIFRFRRLIQTSPANIIEPAMITTPDPRILDSAEFQGSPTMRTVEA
jgi:hypothetical protein